VKKLLLAFSLILFSGCGDSSDSVETNSTVVADEVEVERKSMYLSGVAIDGYLKDAIVRLGEYETTTDENGSWTLEVSADENLSGLFIVIESGVDSDTGNIYEGVLRTPFENNNETIISTPISSLVSFLVEENLSISEAYEKVAEILGTEPKYLKKDHFKFLEEDRNTSEKILKGSLIVQKGSEILAETFEGDNFGFEMFEKGIARTILEDENFTFEKVFENPEKIIERIGGTPDEYKNLDIAKDSLNLLVEQIDQIEFSDKNITFIREEAKAIDLMSETFEEFVRDEKILIDNNLTVEAVKDNILIFGGVVGIAEKIELDQVNSELSQDFFSTEIIKDNKDSYDVFAELGFKDDEIKDLDRDSILEKDLNEEDLEKVFTEFDKIDERIPKDMPLSLARPIDDSIDFNDLNSSDERILF
jgi:hypothetical protein